MLVRKIKLSKNQGAYNESKNENDIEIEIEETKVITNKIKIRNLIEEKESILKEIKRWELRISEIDDLIDKAQPVIQTINQGK